MANKIEYTELEAKQFVPTTSRYNASRVLKYSEERITTFETYKRKPFIMSQQDQLTVITPGMEYRPDLMSMDKYGTTDFWWRIMEANKMKDITEFKAGRTIVLPENAYG
jgi:hypothetical protein